MFQRKSTEAKKKFLKNAILLRLIYALIWFSFKIAFQRSRDSWLFTVKW